MVGAQALEFLKPLKPGIGVQHAYDVVRAHIPALEDDRYLAPEIETVVRLVHTGAFSSIHSALPVR
jgi:histidine ammonia-lyase